MNSMKQFETVLEIASCGSISKAAKKLRIAQPTLSKYIATIEDELGTELFDRRTIPIKLTKAGELFVKAGRQILDMYAHLQKDISRLCNDSPDILRVGMSPTRAHYILPKLIKEFRKLNPGTKVAIYERTTAQLNAELARGDLDLIISLRYEGTRPFASVSLFFEDVMLAVPQKYKDYDAVHVLKECPFISVGSGLRMAEVLSSILSRFGGKTPDIEAQSIESVISLVDRGIGAALVPSYIALYGGYENIIFKELPDEVKNYLRKDFVREVCVFYANEGELTQAEKDFISACQKTS